MEPNRPVVLVAHAWTSTAEPLAALLAARRPGLDVRHVTVADLDAAVTAAPGALVLTDRSSPAVDRHARGWILCYPYPDHPDYAVVGDRAGSKRIAQPWVADLIAAVDELVAQRAPECWGE